MLTTIRKLLYCSCLAIALLSAYAAAFDMSARAEAIRAPSRSLSQWLTEEKELTESSVAVSDGLPKRFAKARFLRECVAYGDAGKTDAPSCFRPDTDFGRENERSPG